jgi:hypothetical protein
MRVVVLLGAALLAVKKWRFGKMFSNVPRGGVYLSTDATMLGLPSISDAYWIMAGCIDRYALTTLSEAGITRVSRVCVFRAQGGGE